jgi:uncharacterized protein (TIGR03437 family)
MKNIVICALVTCVISCSQASGQSGIITTVAGSGPAEGSSGGFSGDGGPATSAELNFTSSVRVDASGNLFIADFKNSRIRRVSASGIITTVAGNGVQGFSGDGGPANSASLNRPVAVAVDTSGNLFIADTYNSRIRKVSAGGMITTVAGNGSYGFSGDGGPATSASLNYPEGVAVDAAGNLFIADDLNNRIRQVSVSGIITTVAGNGTQGFSGDGGPATRASFYAPKDIVVDAFENLFIVDNFNSRLRKVSASGIITTVAGNGTTVFCGQGSCVGDGGPATSASLGYLQGVAVDASGDLFIADSNNQRIRKVSTTGVITTVAGDGITGFSGDGGPATSAFLDSPYGVAVDASGNLFIADSGNNRVREVLAQAPSLTASPPNINLSIVAGGSATQQISLVSAVGGPWSASASANWITLTPTSGTAPGTISVAISTTSLQPGTYTASITIQNPQASPMQESVSVTVTVITTGATFSITPTALSFQVQQGAPAQSQSQSVQIGGTAGAAWQATAATSAGGPWLSVSPGSGSIPASLTAFVNSAGLTRGTYQGSISVQVPGATPASSMIAVTLTVTAVAQFVQQGAKLIGTGAVDSPQGPWEGYSVALSGDGNTALVGGFQDNNFTGAAWFFTRSGSAWTQQGGKLVGGGFLSYFGWSVALSADGNTAIVGWPYANYFAGGASVYTRSAGVWTQQGSALVGTGAISGYPNGSFQGSSVALSSDGNTAIVGGPNDNNSAGAAWVFTRSGGVWTQQGIKLVGSGAAGFAAQGSSVAISGDGNTAMVGGPCDNPGTSATCQGNVGAAWVFTRSGGVWIQQGGKLVGSGAVGSSGQGSSVALSGDGNTAIVGGPNDSNLAGAVWTFTRTGAGWTQQGSKLTGAGAVGLPGQGSSVSLSSDGNTAVVGGPNDNHPTGPGAAWVFARSGNLWTQQGGKLVGTGAAGEAGQGSSVAVSGDSTTVMVGGPWDGGEFGSGAVWVFVPSSTNLPAPTIMSGGIVPLDSSVNSIQPGEWVSIYGANLASTALSWKGDFPTSLGGSSVAINGKSAYVSFVSPTQINLQAPDDTATGSVPAVVTTASGTATSTVTLAQFAPSFLLLDSKHVAAIILRSNGSGAYGGGSYDILGPTGNSLGYATVAAKAGDTIALYAVGLGPTAPAVPAGEAFSGSAPATYPVNLLINKMNVISTFAGLSSAGLYQINLTVPSGLGTGDVSLVATVGGVQTQTGVVISLQ